MFWRRKAEESKQQLVYYLLVTSPDGSVDTHYVTEEPITVGRSMGATITVREVAVSRHHCVIAYAGGGISILDKGSTNGTYVNGVRVKQARLRHGDVIRVGATQLRVQAQTEDATDGPEAVVDTVQPAQIRALLPHEQLAMVRGAAERLSLVQTPELAGSIVLETLLEAVPAERGYILVRDGAEATPRILSSQTTDGSDDIVSPEDLSLDVVLRAMKSGKVFRHPPAEGAQRPPSQAPVRGVRGSVVCLPLRSCGEVFGSIYLAAEQLPDWTGTREMMAVLGLLADVGAQALGRLCVDRDLASGEGVGEGGELGASVGGTLDQIVRERTRVVEEQRIELAERIEELEHLQRSRSRLSQGLVHDIQGLASGLGSKLSLIQSKLPIKSDAMVAAKDAASGIERILAMADDVAAISKFEDGHFPLFTKPIDAEEFANEAVQAHAPLARAYGVGLELGPQAMDIMVVADASILRRALDNLISNAVRNAGRGGFVVVSTARVEGALEFIVKDSGPGVPVEDRDRVFSEWYAVDDTRRQYGIGLYFCRLVARAHGGRIWVEGERGDNRFILSLPGRGDGDETGIHRAPDLDDEGLS